MKREEKAQLTQRRIMNSALNEFSQKGYGASSINTICEAENISKGLVYHYFETKDDLFLSCVAECFHRIAQYIKDNMDLENGSVEERLEKYFNIRMRFFQENPIYQRIFCDSVITPPSHLSDAIKEKKQEFDTLNIQILKKLLTPVSLRSNISKETVIEIFRQFQDFINIHYQSENSSFEEREERCRKALNVLLYGVIERN